MKKTKKTKKKSLRTDELCTIIGGVQGNDGTFKVFKPGGGTIIVGPTGEEIAK